MTTQHQMGASCLLSDLMSHHDSPHSWLNGGPPKNVYPDCVNVTLFAKLVFGNIVCIALYPMLSMLIIEEEMWRRRQRLSGAHKARSASGHQEWKSYPWNWTLPESHREDWPSWYLDFEFLDFWPPELWRKTFFFLTIQFVLMCHGSPRKQVHSFKNLASKNTELLKVTWTHCTHAHIIYSPNSLGIRWSWPKSHFHNL